MEWWNPEAMQFRHHGGMATEVFASAGCRATLREHGRDFAGRIHDGANSRFADDSFALARREFAGQGHKAFPRADDGQREHHMGDAVGAIETDSRRAAPRKSAAPRRPSSR